MCKLNSVMSKNRKHLQLSHNVLQQLITSQDSCVEVVRDKKHITLYPYHLKNVSNSIREILDQGIGKYIRNLDGVLLSYKNVKLLTNLGVINNKSCFIHTDIEADFIIFQPIVGKQLPAVVTKRSQDHVGCLVYQTFNVSLPKPEGIKNWPGKNVDVEQEIIIRVTLVNLDARLPYIRGEFLNSTSENNTSRPTANKKIIFNDEDEQLPEVKIKEKRKRKREISDLDDSVCNKRNKKKKVDIEHTFESDYVKKEKESDDDYCESKASLKLLEGEGSEMFETSIKGEFSKAKRKKKTEQSPFGDLNTNNKKKRKKYVKEEIESEDQFEEKPNISENSESEF